MNDKLNELNTRLADAIKLCDYWRERRHGQVGNCISDQEHELDAWRLRQSLEFQIRELEKA